MRARKRGSEWLKRHNPVLQSYGRHCTDDIGKSVCTYACVCVCERELVINQVLGRLTSLGCRVILDWIGRLFLKRQSVGGES